MAEMTSFLNLLDSRWLNLYRDLFTEWLGVDCSKLTGEQVQEMIKAQNIEGIEE